jgi:hypothetical protein
VQAERKNKKNTKFFCFSRGEAYLKAPKGIKDSANREIKQEKLYFFWFIRGAAVWTNTYNANCYRLVTTG